MNLKLLKLAVIATTFTLMTNSCKKETKEVNQTKTSNLASVASLNNQPLEFSEDEIKTFITDVDYYHNNTTANQWLGAAETIQKMQTSTNYMYSDIDTAFASEDTFGYTFTLLPNTNGQYCMTEISSKIFDIRSFLNTKLGEDQGSNYVGRVVTVDVDQNPDGSGTFLLTLYLGKAYKNPPEYGSNTTEGFQVSDGDHPWFNGYPNTLVTNICTHTLGVKDILETYGPGYLLDMRNKAVTPKPTVINGVALMNYQIPYLDGSSDLINSRTSDPQHPNASDYLFSYDDVINLNSSNRPTSALGNCNGANIYVEPSGIFAMNPCPTYPFYILYDVWPPGPIGIPHNELHIAYYNWCMPQDFINYYLSNVAEVFAKVRPNSYILPLSDYASFQVSYSKWFNYLYLESTSAKIYHAYKYKYTILRIRDIRV